MNTYSSTRRKTPSARPMLIAVLASFLLGGAVAGYAVYTLSEGAEPVAAPADEDPVSLASPTADPSPTPSATASQAARDAVERVAEQQGGLDTRLAAAEQRLARVDLQAQAAAGNTARAEGLLIAFATRRALEKGAELGYLADQLRLRFGDAMPNAVDTIIRTSRDPITLDQLIARLEGFRRGWRRPANRTVSPASPKNCRNCSWSAAKAHPRRSRSAGSTGRGCSSRADARIGDRRSAQPARRRPGGGMAARCRTLRRRAACAGPHRNRGGARTASPARWRGQSHRTPSPAEES